MLSFEGTSYALPLQSIQAIHDKVEDGEPIYNHAGWENLFKQLHQTAKTPTKSTNNHHSLT